MTDHYRSTRFLTGAVAPAHFPPDEGWEVAIVGRSNSGKSSAINTLTGIRALARVSKTPGRTREINFFAIDPQRRLVDLPGYGYAKVPQAMKAQWQTMLNHYLSGRDTLRGLLIVMDVRHPLTDFDQQMLAWCRHAELPVHILLTKADKLSRGAAHNILHQVRRALATDPLCTVQLFSALKRSGVEEVQGVLDTWLEILSD